MAGLPEPARRYLLRSIAPGTPLSRSVELEMSGEIRLEPDGDPLAIVADQILAPPLGFVWNAQAGRGMMRIQGFDRYGSGEGEMRWRFWGTIPEMSAMRWSEDAGPGYDLLVVELRGELEVDGYRIPRELTAGWRLGAEDEFRFYRATLQRASFQ